MASVTITQQWENGQATQVKAEGWEFDAGGMAEVAETGGATVVKLISAGTPTVSVVAS